jgi:NAD(P)-dependent dehydrogenase (short-subunit alcohol dehydrogenase family)
MKNYLIIGGSSGIGKELSLIMSKKGYNVFTTYCSHPQDSDMPNLTYHYLNVNEEEYDLSFLPDQLDGVAYCPGSINLMPFNRIKSENFIKDFQLQVIGAINVLQAIYPKLKAVKNASIVLFSTVAVQTGFSFHSQVAVSKGAIEGLTKALAAEFAPNIRVNAVAPSITDTPLAAKYLNSDEKIMANTQKHPLKKIGSPKDIAEMAAFLLTEQSSWMTGQILHVDGGISSIKL